MKNKFKKSVVREFKSDFKEREMGRKNVYSATTSVIIIRPLPSFFFISTIWYKFLHLFDYFPTSPANRLRLALQPTVQKLDRQYRSIFFLAFLSVFP